MKATVCHPSELGDAEIADWQRMQHELPALAHPFLTSEFARAIGQASKHARVAVIEDSGETVAFLAHGHGALGIAHPIGGRLSYRQGLVHRDAWQWSWPDVTRASNLHAIAFTDLIGAQAGADDALAMNPSPLIETAAGWDVYLEQARRHGHIRKAMKRARQLERDVGPLEFTWGPVMPAEFAQLIAWKSAQYRRSGWPDPFARPWIREALDVLVAGIGDLQLVSTTLRAGDDLLAVDMSLVYGDVIPAWFSTYNQEFASYSPGAIRRMHTIERACNDHFAYIDLARGDEPYKQEFKNADVPVATGLVHDRSGSALLYRSLRAPYRGTRSWILGKPRTRAFVRTSLRRSGALRVRVRPHAAPAPEPVAARS